MSVTSEVSSGRERSRSSRWRTLRHELAKFGTVGGICYIIDVLVFNLCHAVISMDLYSSKIISTVIAATCAYIGNRHWSFTHRARTGTRREYTLFIVLNTIGLFIALACLALTRDVLGFSGTLAVNIGGNIIGTGLASVFRFWAYKRWVFLHPEHPKAVEYAEAASAPARVPEPAGRV